MAILTESLGREGLKAEMEAWCREQSWGWRAAVWLYVTYAGFRHLQDPFYPGLFSGVTLVVHEAGHLLFSYFGQFLMVAGGSICQVMVPLLLAGFFYRQRDYFGVSVMGGWLAVSLMNLSFYVGDAMAQGLPLVGFSSDPLHDWNYLLGAMGLLSLAGAFAALIRGIAVIVLATSLAFGGWLIERMMRSTHRVI